MANDNSLVSKSKPLLQMKNSGFNEGEFKILDIYLSRINPLEPSSSKVSFTLEEYCEAMGIQCGKVRTTQLKKYTSHFLGNIVTTPRPDNKKGYIQKPLFTYAEYDEEEKKIILECNTDPEIFASFFDIKNIGYIKYRLANILKLNSVYAIKLYLLAKEKTWACNSFKINLRDFRERLECTQKSYESFKELRRRILDPSINEINKNTDIQINYEREIRGRLTVGLIFNVKGRPAQLLPEEKLEQMSFIPESEIRNVYDNDLMEFYAEAFDYEFTQEQLNILLALPTMQQMHDISISLNSNQLKKHDFFSQKYAELNYRCRRTDLKPIENRFAYLKSIIETGS